jgi:tetratricopeptide (TPR) repeat protein
LKSTSKLVSGHPGPEDFKDLRYKREVILAWTEKAKEDMKGLDYQGATALWTRILKEEPNNPEALLQRATCAMNSNEFKIAIPDLLQLVHENPLYDKKVYIVLAMCFAQLSDYETAIRQLSKGLLKFPKFSEGFVTRGQLYSQQMKWEKALQDFSRAISLNKTEGSAFLGLGDAFLGMGDQKSALKAFSQAGQIPSTGFSGLVRRAKLLFELQDYEKSLIDLEEALKFNSEDAEVFYYKALALLSQEQLTEASLCLEQVLKFDVNEKKYTGAAIYNLGAIKIKQKDYYGAMYTFKRASDLELEVKEQKILKGYVDAILCLMKRKFKEGISLLSRIIKKKHPLIQEYIGNCYAFRGYGYASIEKHEQAVKNLNTAGKIQVLDNASKYNLMVSNAVVRAEKEPSDALNLLEEAARDFPKNIEPLAYQAAIHLCLARKAGNVKLADRAKVLLDKAVVIRDSESDLYYFRALVVYFMGRPVEAIPDLETAIDKAEDNMPIHFMTRGLCYAQLKLIKEAMQDFSIAIQLNENLSEPYYYRGRCAFLLDDTQTAFQDFQKMIVNKHEDPIVHVHAGNLLMLVGSIEDAVKAFTNANSIRPTPQAYIQRGKSYILLEQLQSALEDFKSAQDISFDKKVEFDMEFLTIISESIDSSDLKPFLMKKLSRLSKLMQLHTEGHVFSTKHIHWAKGVYYFYICEYQKAKVEYKASLGTTPAEDLNNEKDNLQIVYNLSLCYILSDQLEAALIHLQELSYVIEGADRGKVVLLIGIIQLALQESEEARALMLEAFKYDPSTSSAYLEEKADIEVLPFVNNKFLTFENCLRQVKLADCHPVLVRPCFSIPTSIKPSMDFVIEENILDNFLVKSVKSKPEAPWLNRVKGTIQFTDEIREIGSESIVSTKKSDSDGESLSSIFDSSFADAKVFRSAVVFPSKEKKVETVELLNFGNKDEEFE